MSTPIAGSYRRLKDDGRLVFVSSVEEQGSWVFGTFKMVYYSVQGLDGKWIVNAGVEHSLVQFSAQLPDFMEATEAVVSDRPLTPAEVRAAAVAMKEVQS